MSFKSKSPLLSVRGGKGLIIIMIINFCPSQETWTQKSTFPPFTDSDILWMPKSLDPDGFLLRNYWLEKGGERGKLNWDLRQWADLGGISEALMSWQQIPLFIFSKQNSHLPATLAWSLRNNKRWGSSSGSGWLYRDKREMVTRQVIGTKTILMDHRGWKTFNEELKKSQWLNHRILPLATLYISDMNRYPQSFFLPVILLSVK